MPPPKWAHEPIGSNAFGKDSDAAMAAMEGGLMEYRKNHNATGRAFLFVNYRGMELRGPNVFDKNETDELRLPIDWDAMSWGRWE